MDVAELDRVEDEAALGWAGSDGFVTGVGVLVIVAGCALGVLRLADASPGEPIGTGLIESFALGLVIAAPGMLALLARYDRPAMMLPAAVVLIPCSFLSFALVTLPLLVPAVMLFIGYHRRSRSHPIGWLRATTLTLAVLVLLIAALAALLSHQDPRSYSDGSTQTGISDVITAAEALASLSLIAAALGVGWVLAAHPDSRGGGGSGHRRAARGGASVPGTNLPPPVRRGRGTSR